MSPQASLDNSIIHANINIPVMLRNDYTLTKFIFTLLWAVQRWIDGVKNVVHTEIYQHGDYGEIFRALCKMVKEFIWRLECMIKSYKNTYFGVLVFLAYKCCLSVFFYITWAMYGRWPLGHSITAVPEFTPNWHCMHQVVSASLLFSVQ